MRKLIARLKAPHTRQEVTDVYLLVMLLVFPLFTGFSGYAAITLSKFCFFLTATLLWLAALVWLSLRQRLPWPRLSGAQIPMAFFLLLCCVSTLLSDTPGQSLLGAGRFDGLLTWLLYGLVFLGVSAFGRFRLRHAAAFGAAVTLCCLTALLQLLGYNPLGLFPGELSYYDAHIRYTSEFLGTIGNVNLLSAMLCLAIPLFFALSVTGSGRSRAAFLVPLFFAVLVLTASGVSGGALAMVLCALAAMPLLFTELPRLRRGLAAGAVCLLAMSLALALEGSAAGWSLAFGTPSLLLLAAAALALALSSLLPLCPRFPSGRALGRFWLALSLLALLAALVLLWFWPEESGTLYELSQVLHGHVEESYGSSRIRIWRRVLELFPEAPLLGSGLGTLALRLEIAFSRYVPETGQTLHSVADNAHNVYLQLLAETGLWGLAAYLATLGTVLFSWLRRRGQTTLLCLGLAIFAYAVQAFFGLELCLTAPLFWILLGLTASEVINSSPSEA